MNILHLSDIHFGRNYARYSIKDCFDLKSEILDELIKTYKSGDTRKVSFRACDETQRVTMIYWSEEELDFHDSDNYVVIPALSTELGVLYTKQDF